MDAQHIGKNIQLQRQKKGLTQQQLCEQSGLSYSTLAKIERGAIKSPSIFTVMSITQALNIELKDLTKPLQKSSNKKAQTRDTGTKFVYFDIHGVLLHFYERGFMTLAQEAGARIEVVENTFWHYNDSVCRGEMSLDDFNRALASKLNVKEVSWEKHYFDAIVPVEPVVSVLKLASKKYKVGLLSNIFPGFLPKLIKKGVLPNISYAAIVDSSEVKAIKPEPLIYELAEKMSGYSGPEIAYIDDSRNYIMAAEKFGWKIMWCDDYRPTDSAKKLAAVLDLA